MIGILKMEIHRQYSQVASDHSKMIIIFTLNHLKNRKPR